MSCHSARLPKHRFTAHEPRSDLSHKTSATSAASCPAWDLAVTCPNQEPLQHPVSRPQTFLDFATPRNLPYLATARITWQLVTIRSTCILTHLGTQAALSHQAPHASSRHTTAAQPLHYLTVTCSLHYVPSQPGTPEDTCHTSEPLAVSCHRL